MPPPSKPRPVPATACFRLMLPRTETKRRQNRRNKGRPATFPDGIVRTSPACVPAKAGRSVAYASESSIGGAGIPPTPDGERYPKTDGGKCHGHRAEPERTVSRFRPYDHAPKTGRSDRTADKGRTEKTAATRPLSGDERNHSSTSTSAIPSSTALISAQSASACCRLSKLPIV